MAEISAIQEMLKVLEHQTRNKIISEIQAFVGEYHFHYGGRDVVIVDQLLDFLHKPRD